MDEPGIGHNGVAADELMQFIERIEHVEEETSDRNGDKRDIYAELKGRGFCTKTVKRILALRRKDYAQRQEEDAILELYMQALGMS